MHLLLANYVVAVEMFSITIIFVYKRYITYAIYSV